MRKNVASQVIVGQLIAKADGTPVTTGTTTVYVLGDGGTQGAGSGTVTHEGNGCWSYVPTQAETNYNHVAFTFVNTNAINVTVQVYTTGYDPTTMVSQTGDSYTRLGAPAGASISADVAAVKSDTAAILDDTGTSGVVVAAASKTGYSIGTGGIAAAAFAAGAIDAAALAADAANEIADAYLGRNIAGGSSTGRLVKDCHRLLRNRFAISGGTLTVYQEDDTIPAWTAAVTQTAGNPISEVDPA